MSDKPHHFKQGNTLARSLNDEDIDLMRQAYDLYCSHIASGKPKESWKWRHPTDIRKSMTAKTMQKYIDQFGEEVFPAEQREMALSDNYGHWFGVTSDSATGVNTKANPKSIEMIMRNIHGWNKTSSTKTETTASGTTVTVTKYADTDD